MRYCRVILGPDMVRLGIIGTGNIGQQHLTLITSGAIEGALLTATASRSAATRTKDIQHYDNYLDMLDSNAIDAVLIATPTMKHIECALAAIQRGIHVLMEKPIAMSVAEASGLIDQVPPGIQFAVMLNQRFHPAYSRLKQLMDDAVIGRLNRFNWTMTAWYRPDIYYRVSSWRGTWPGEGGGLLINQCIHNLDIMQWLFGLPTSLVAKIGFGRFHDIEVEDDVTTIMNYPENVTGVLIASSGEAPGINRLEIVGDLGLITFDGNDISLQQADQSISEHCAMTKEMFGMPNFSQQGVPPGEDINQHATVIQNFVNAIALGEPLLTPGEAGLGSLKLANAMLLSAWQNSEVSLPIETVLFQDALDKKIDASSLRQPEDLEVEIDMEKSYR